MPKTSKIIACVSVLAFASFSSACNSYSSGHSETTKVAAPMVETAPTIVELAVGSDDLTTLVAAVTAAGLVDTLNSAGQFTVFAPTNAAFAKLPAGTVETLVMPENKDKLASILTYHVVGAEVMAADLVQAIKDSGGSYTVPTVNGDSLTASIINENVYLQDSNGEFSKVIATDLDASNGVVHLLDSVVLPK